MFHNQLKNDFVMDSVNYVTCRFCWEQVGGLDVLSDKQGWIWSPQFVITSSGETRDYIRAESTFNGTLRWHASVRMQESKMNLYIRELTGGIPSGGIDLSYRFSVLKPPYEPLARYGSQLG